MTIMFPLVLVPSYNVSGVSFIGGQLLPMFHLFLLLYRLLSPKNDALPSLTVFDSEGGS